MDPAPIPYYEADPFETVRRIMATIDTDRLSRLCDQQGKLYSKDYWPHARYYMESWLRGILTGMLTKGGREDVIIEPFGISVAKRYEEGQWWVYLRIYIIHKTDTRTISDKGEVTPGITRIP